MKKHLVFICIILLLAGGSKAQLSLFQIDADNTLSPLEKRRVTTGILLERVPDIANTSNTFSNF